MTVSDEYLRVGDIAKAVGKSVRAIHLYEQHDLLIPTQRSAAGYRLYTQESVERVHWILKLQGIGFSLTEIKEFVSVFEKANTARDGALKVREVFAQRLDEVREKLSALQTLEKDLLETIGYLESCGECGDEHIPAGCGVCDRAEESAPPLFVGLTRSVNQYDVAAEKLSREGNQ